MNSLFTLTPKQRQYQRAYGLRFSSLFAAIVAVAWTGIMSQYTQDNSLPPVLLLVYFMCFVIIALCVYHFKRYKPPEKVTLPYRRSWRFWRLFYVVIIAEIIIIYSLIQYFNSLHLSEPMWPLIVGIVSIHWIPLGRMHGTYTWYYVATFLVICVIAIVLFIGRQASINILGISGNTWSVLSIGLMIITMLITSLICLIQIVNAKHNK
jgi:hypothetical protein